MKRRAITVCSLLALTLVASVSHAQQMKDFDGPIAVSQFEGNKYAISIHNTDSLLWMFKKTGAMKEDLGPENFQAVAEHFVAPVKCTISKVWQQRNGIGLIFWYARYECPTGIDLRQIVIANAKSLKKGDPLPAVITIP